MPFPTPCWWWIRNLHVRETNPRAEVMFEMRAESVVGTPVQALVVQEDRAAFGAQLGRYFAESHLWSTGMAAGLRAMHADGSIFYVDISLGPFEHGGDPLVIAIVRDVTEAHHQARHGAEQDDRLRTLLELARVGTWELDLATGERHYSPELLSLLGKSTAHPDRDAFFEAVHPDHRSAVRQATQQALREGRPYHQRLPVLTGAGSYRWFETQARVEFDEAGQPRRLQGMALDVHDIVAVQEALRRTEATLAAIFERIPDTILQHVDGRIIYANRAAAELFGVGRPEDLLGAGMADLVVPEQREQAIEQAREVTNSGTPAPATEWTVLRLDGSARVVETRSSRVPHLGHWAVLAVSRDITERKHMENEVVELRMAMEHALEGIARCGPSGRIRSTNGAFARIHGQAPQALIGATWRDLVAPADHDAYSLALRQLALTGRADVETMALRADGSQFARHTTLVRLAQNDTQAPGHYSFVRDVSEQRRVRDQLFVADRMASLGLLAAGVAHEINNPLTAVLGNIEMAQQDLAALQPVDNPLVQIAEELADAREAVERVCQIAGDLKVFSRSEKRKLSAVDAERVLDSSLRMARNEIRHRARLVRTYAGVPPVQAEEARLGQVFLNLVVNAAQAIPEGTAEDNEIRLTTSLHPDGRIQIEIEDTGVGMSADVLDQIFTPFFTSKPAGMGTGLGLTISQRIVEELGGELQVESELGQGTTFRVLLPRALVETSVPGSAVAAEDSPRRRGRVLVIDDEPSIGRTVARMLVPEHDVTVLTNGADALDLIQRGERYDVILCDLMMPQMTGADVYDALKGLEPEQATRMVFLTGGAFTPRADSFLSDVPNERMEKPFDPTALRAAVNARVD